MCPTALAIPTQQLMNSCDARTWPASYVEEWYGDGALSQGRDRPMLFEEVARRLINVDEQEYTVSKGAEPYEDSCQGPFNNPEFVVVLGDVIRRLRLLRAPSWRSSGKVSPRISRPQVAPQQKI